MGWQEDVSNFFDDTSSWKGVRNLGAALGGVALAESAADRIEGLGDTAKSTIRDFQDQLGTDLEFTPFSTTAELVLCQWMMRKTRYGLLVLQHYKII